MDVCDGLDSLSKKFLTYSLIAVTSLKVDCDGHCNEKLSVIIFCDELCDLQNSIRKKLRRNLLTDFLAASSSLTEIATGFLVTKKSIGLLSWENCDEIFTTDFIEICYFRRKFHRKCLKLYKKFSFTSDVAKLK